MEVDSVLRQVDAQFAVGIGKQRHQIDERTPRLGVAQLHQPRIERPHLRIMPLESGIGQPPGIDRQGCFLNNR